MLKMHLRRSLGFRHDDGPEEVVKKESLLEAASGPWMVLWVALVRGSAGLGRVVKSMAWEVFFGTLIFANTLAMCFELQYRGMVACQEIGYSGEEGISNDPGVEGFF